MPTVEFKLFSIDATGSPPNPATATTSITIPFPKNLRNAESEAIIHPPVGRGSVQKTLTGIVVQDFGLPTKMAGGTISFDDFESLSLATKNALETAYNAVSTQWYFSDSVDTYKVMFSREPAGFKFWRNYAIYAATGTQIFSYTLDLTIIEKVT